MANLLNQVRTKFTGVVENKADHGGSSDQKIPTQKTESYKAEKKKGQNWFSKFGRKTSRDYDTEEHAAAVAAAAFAIDSQVDAEQKQTATREASLTKTKSKVERTKTPISLFGSASKRLSGSFRSMDDQGDKVPRAPVTDERKPEKAITAAPSVKKSSTFTDKQPETTAPDVPEPIRQTPTGTGIGETKAEEWERTELEKIRERYEKLKKTIDSWENKMQVKAKRKLNKEESELQRRRLKALENFHNDMKYIDEAASGARAKADERQRNEELKAHEKANEIRKTGKLPGICSCF